MYIKTKSTITNKKRVYCLFATFVVLLLFASIAFSISAHKELSYKYYYKGIYIDSVDISGLTKEQAKKNLEYEFSKNCRSEAISLLYGEKVWKIPLKSINYQYDFEGTLNYAYKVGHEGSLMERLRTIKSLKSTPINLIVPGKFDNTKIVEKLNIIKKEIDFLSIPSTYNYNYGKISYTKDVDGKNFDIEENAKLIETQLLNRNFNDVFLVVQVVEPSISVDDVIELKDVLATYTTRFNVNNYSRAHNIQLACKKINNKLLLPGEEFSMDLSLGPRTAEQGFMQAPIIMKSEIVPGAGGGVCQVASTLYNAVLLSMLQVTSRVHHSIALSYVPPGQDATISEGYIDLKFKNNRDYTICVVSEVHDGNVTIKIIGKRTNADPRVLLRPIIVEEYEPPEAEYVINEGLSDGQKIYKTKEKKGLKVILYRDTYNEQGELINSEKISQDIYKPVRGVLAVNRKTFEALKNK